MAQAEKNKAIEYSVYVYHNDDKKKKGGKPWEMVSVTENMDKAFKSAEELIGSREYPKVEVKKKFFDEKNNRTVDITLKVLEGKVKKPIGVGTLTLIALICGAAAFALAFFNSNKEHLLGFVN